MEIIALLLTAVGCTGGATWAICAAISKVERALAAHVLEDAEYHAKVISLEKQAARKRR